MREFWMRLMSVCRWIVGLILGYNSVLEARAKDEEIAKLKAKIEKYGKFRRSGFKKRFL